MRRRISKLGLLSDVHAVGVLRAVCVLLLLLLLLVVRIMRVVLVRRPCGLVVVVLLLQVLLLMMMVDGGHARALLAPGLAHSRRVELGVSGHRQLRVSPRWVLLQQLLLEQQRQVPAVSE